MPSWHPPDSDSGSVQDDESIIKVHNDAKTRFSWIWPFGIWTTFSDWLGVSVVFDTSCPSRDDPLKEYSMLFPSKLNTQEFNVCAMKKYWPVHLSWNTRRRHQSFSASTQPSQTWHAQPKRTGEKQTHFPCDYLCNLFIFILLCTLSLLQK